MKRLALFLLATLCAAGETPEDWFAAYYAHEEKDTQRRIAYVEAHLPGDTTYRKLCEQSLSGQMPLFRYLLRYYLMNDPDRLVWDEHGPFLQVMPCNCGAENSVDSETFRALFPAYSKASCAWDEIDPELRRRYADLWIEMSKDGKLRQTNETEMAELKARFEKLKATFKRQKEAS